MASRMDSTGETGRIQVHNKIIYIQFLTYQRSKQFLSLSIYILMSFMVTITLLTYLLKSTPDKLLQKTIALEKFDL